MEILFLSNFCFVAASSFGLLSHMSASLLCAQFPVSQEPLDQQNSLGAFCAGRLSTL